MVVKQGISVNKEMGRGQLNAAYGGLGKRDSLAPSMRNETPFVLRCFLLLESKAIVCQDRLGTNRETEN